jgi:hypothetical protein
MLKIMAIFLLFCATAFLAGVISVGIAPYYYYNSIVNGKESFEWYSLRSFQDNYTTPNKSRDLNFQKISDERLWKNFHFKNQMIPIPVRNPFYFVAPVLKFTPNNKNTEFGISIFNASNDVISQVYFLPKINFPSAARSQKLFEFPIVLNYLKSIKQEKIWKDLFTKDISDWNIPYEEMVYNLYLLEIRSHLFNKRTMKYYYLDNVEKAVIQVEHKNQDYISEVVMTRRGENIYSFIMVSQKENKEAKNLRFKFLSDMEFVDTTPTLADIIYKEFKGLEHNRQTDHEGMLYMLSAWSHAQSRLEFIKVAIGFLERGAENQKQLSPLYSYMFKRVGKTFAKKGILGLELDSDVKLKHMIELEREKKIKQEKYNEQKPEIIPDKKISIKEEYEQIIEKSKEKMVLPKNKIRMN